jgi:hypothetical protein
MEQKTVVVVIPEADSQPRQRLPERRLPLGKGKSAPLLKLVVVVEIR